MFLLRELNLLYLIYYFYCMAKTRLLNFPKRSNHRGAQEKGGDEDMQWSFVLLINISLCFCASASSWLADFPWKSRNPLRFKEHFPPPQWAQTHLFPFNYSCFCVIGTWRGSHRYKRWQIRTPCSPPSQCLVVQQEIPSSQRF